MSAFIQSVALVLPLSFFVSVLQRQGKHLKLQKRCRNISRSLRSKQKFLKLRPPLLYLSKCSYIATRTVRGEVCSNIFCCHYSCTLGLWMWGRGSAAAVPSCLWAKAGLDKSPVYHRTTSHSHLQAIWSSQFASHS